MSQGESCPFQRCVDKKRTGCYSTRERIRENLGQSELGRTVAECENMKEKTIIYWDTHTSAPECECVSKELRGS